MKYLEYDERYWALDIEADNLLEDATRIWCVCVENIKTGEKRAFTDSASFKAWLSKDICLVGHNIIAYDLVMLNRFWDAQIGISRVVDTYVLSQLYNPTFAGGHSLGEWGRRLKFPKGEHNDFSKLSDEMLTYCANDTALTALLYRKIAARMVSVGFTEQGCEIEHLAWNIIQNKQRRHGFPFDQQKAEELYTTLRAREEELKNEIYKLFPPQYTVVASFARSRKQDGTPTSHYLRHLQQYPELRDRPDGGYDAYDFVSFNIGSPKQRIAKLLEAGWQPTSFTEKGSPKVDEETLIEYADETDTPEIKAIAKWLVCNSRANMVRTWLDACDRDGAIHGKVFIASTLRYRHSQPNTANIPAVKKDKDTKEILYGERGTWAYECRDLWTCGDPDKYSLVGIDAKGLQLRILANYAYSEEFANLVLTGDPHERNAQVLGLANKPAAKKFVYTLIMGGGGARLASDQLQFGTKLTEREGYVLKNKFIASIPGFKELIASLEDQLAKTGRIRLCDGTPILVPSPHMVIPYLLQGDESRIMKLASIYLDQEIRRAGIEAYKVGDIHDEWQFVVANEDVEIFIALALEVFPRVGKQFNYRVPIEGSAEVGLTWAETH